MNSPTHDSPGQRITLHIEELVLHGAKPGDRHHIADAVQTELQRMLVSEGVPRWLESRTSIDRLDAASQPVPRATPASFGAVIAQALYHATEAPSVSRPAAK